MWLTRFVINHRVPVLRRLIPSIHRWVLSLLWTNGFNIVRHDGALFLLTLRHKTDRILALKKRYEVGTADFFMSEVRKLGSEVFLDIGANFGYYTVHVARGCGVNSVVAFEPDPRTFNQLCANIFLNDLAFKVRAVNMAVSDSDSTVKFHLHSENAPARAFVDRSESAENEGAIEVKAVSLDRFLDYKDRRLCIKMDVEGYEIYALQGMSRILRENSCFCQVESFPENVDRVKAFFDDQGYTFIRTSGLDHYFHNIKSDEIPE